MYSPLFAWFLNRLGGEARTLARLLMDYAGLETP
jgi:hypothetical protein